uniref:Uncharacterized protein n=1 Tax=Solanum tuberosum TaxID=4113 RepID=M1DHZ9_SOLTU
MVPPTNRPSRRRWVQRLILWAFEQRNPPTVCGSQLVDPKISLSLGLTNKTYLRLIDRTTYRPVESSLSTGTFKIWKTRTDQPRAYLRSANWGSKMEKENVERDLARKSAPRTCSPSDQKVALHPG